MQHVRLAICLLVLAFACLVWARKDVIDIRSDDAIVELVLPFGAQNGSVSLELHCTDVGQVSQSSVFHVGIFRKEEWTELQQYRKTLPGLCLLPSVLRFEFITDLAITAALPEFTQYHTALLNCLSRDLSCKGEANFLGEGGQQLSFEENPLVSSSASLLAAYIVCGAVWGVILSRLCRRDQPILYGGLLITLLLVKPAAEAMQLAYLFFYASTGVPSFFLRTCTNLLLLVGEFTFVLIILSGSMGWGITRASLTIRERQIFWGAFIAFVISSTLHGLCEEPRTLCFAYLLTFQVNKGLLAFGCGLAIAVNMAQLFTQLGDRRDPSQRPLIFTRLKYLKDLRGLVVLYFLVPVLFLILGYTVVSWAREPWFIRTLTQLVEIVAVNLLGYSLVKVSSAALG